MCISVTELRWRTGVSTCESLSSQSLGGAAEKAISVVEIGFDHSPSLISLSLPNLTLRNMYNQRYSLSLDFAFTADHKPKFHNIYILFNLS